MSLFPRLPKKFKWQTVHDLILDTAPLSGAGTPAVTLTNAKSIGQIYVDTTASKAYIAKSVTGVPATDWMILN
jgi:hypothetical protein